MSGPTQDHYRALCIAISKGVTTVEVNGRRLTYRNLSEMFRIKAWMESEYGYGNSASGASKLTYPVFDKGY